MKNINEIKFEKNTIRTNDKEYINKLINILELNNWTRFSERNKYFLCGYKNENLVIKFWTNKSNRFTVWTNSPITINNLILNKQNNKFRNYIEIDEAGWGSQVGSVAIGFYNTIDNSLESEFLDIKYFQSPLFEDKKYLKETTRIILNYLDKKKINKIKDEVQVKICTGYIFNDATKQLYKQGYNIKQSKITGKLQNYIEKAFNKKLESDLKRYNPKFKLKRFGETFESRKKYFYYVINLIRNNPKILEYSKTGWNYFKNYY